MTINAWDNSWGNAWEAFARRSREMVEHQAELTRSWFEGSGNWSGIMPGRSKPGQIADETLGRFLNPLPQALGGGGPVGETIRRMTEGPRFADLGALERRMAGIIELWLEAQKATWSYEAVVATAWTEAYWRFLDALRARHEAGKTALRPQETLKLWLDIANQTLLETHRSTRFLEAQGALLRQGMDLALAQRQMIEAMVEPAGLPTRSEIDEVHQSVQDLKRRIRTLEKALAKAAQNAVEPTVRNSVEPTVARLSAPGPKAREHRKVSDQGAQP